MGVLKGEKMIFTVMMILLFFATTLNGEITVFVNEDFDNKPIMKLVIETFNGNLNQEEIYWYKQADSGKITYDNARLKIEECRELLRDVQQYTTLKTSSLYFFPAYSLYVRQEGIPIKNRFDFDGNEHNFLIPSEILKFIRLQQDLYELSVDNEYGFSHDVIDKYSGRDKPIEIKVHTAKLEYRYVTRNGANGPYQYKALYERLQFQILRFNKKIRTPDNIKPTTISRWLFIHGKDREPEYYANQNATKLKYVQYLHNNSFLDLTVDINKLKEAIQKEHEDVQNSE